MENKNESSLHRYDQLRKAVAAENRRPTGGELDGLLEQMEQELLIDSCSALFSAAAAAYPGRKKLFGKTYTPRSFSLEPADVRVGVNDARILMECLTDTMAGADTARKRTDALAHFCGSASDRNAPAPDAALSDMLRRVDSLVPLRRAALLAQKPEPVAEVQKEPEPEILDAQARAARIVADAEALAACRIAAASQRILEQSSDPRLRQSMEMQRHCADGIYEIQKRLQDISGQLQAVSEQSRALDQITSEASVRKASISLIELYNLIADVRDAQTRLSADSDNEALKACIRNLDVFLDMITEYLADYGIRTVYTAPGAPFSVTYHTVPRTLKDYDPKTLVVCRSVRHGFVWGEQVLQKELVEVQ